MSSVAFHPNLLLVIALNSNWNAALVLINFLLLLLFLLLIISYYFYFSTFIGNYIYSLVDAKNATDIRPLFILPIIAGNFHGSLRIHPSLNASSLLQKGWVLMVSV